MQRYNRGAGMYCGKCGYAYVLNPKVSPFIGDRPVYRAAITLHDSDRPYTVNQVVAVLARRKKLRLPILRQFTEARFNNSRSAVIEVHQRTPLLQGLVAEPRFTTPGSRWPEPDILDYGAERILLVDEPHLVDFLVRAGVHVQAKAAILSLSGYPHWVTALARELVQDRPDVPIAVLHASGRDVADVARRARDTLGAAPHVAVTDLGLAPNAAKTVRSLRWARRLPSVAVDCLPFGALVGGLAGALVTGRPMDADSDEPSWSWLFDADFG